MLESLAERVREVLQNNHPEYVMALPHISQYYDMKLVTFGIDQNNISDHSSYFIRPKHSVPLTLYEIETVDVPIVDENDEMDSYTKVQISKPYIAATISKTIISNFKLQS